MKAPSFLAAAVLWCATILGVAAAGVDTQKPFRLTTLLGETFENCRIIKVTPATVSVAHDDGVARVPFTNLSEEWRKLFHYNEDKAREYTAAESEKAAEAEVKRKQAQRNSEKLQNKQMKELADAEEKRRALEEKIARQQAEAQSTANTTTTGGSGLLPLPGESGPQVGTTLSNGQTTITSGTQIMVPPTTPLGQPFAPSVNGGQRYILNQGAVITPGDGTLYYVNPTYGGYSYGNAPIIVIPPQQTKPVPQTHVPQPFQPKPGATIQKGGKAIHVGP